MTCETLQLWTVPALADSLSLTARQVDFAIRKERIPPTALVGGSRVYDRTARARIEAALRATGALAAEPVAAEVGA